MDHPQPTVILSLRVALHLADTLEALIDLAVIHGEVEMEFEAEVARLELLEAIVRSGGISEAD